MGFGLVDKSEGKCGKIGGELVGDGDIGLVEGEVSFGDGSFEVAFDGIGAGGGAGEPVKPDDAETVDRSFEGEWEAFGKVDLPVDSDVPFSPSVASAFSITSFRPTA